MRNTCGAGLLSTILSRICEDWNGCGLSRCISDMLPVGADGMGPRITLCRIALHPLPLAPSNLTLMGIALLFLFLLTYPHQWPGSLTAASQLQRDLLLTPHPLAAALRALLRGELSEKVFWEPQHIYKVNLSSAPLLTLVKQIY